MTKSQKVLVVGATGYLGLHIIKQLQNNHQDFVALARNKYKLVTNGVNVSQIIEAQVTQPEQIQGICDDVDIVISCLGITRQQDGMSYMDVDYQANLNLLLEAERAGVKRFIYISAFNARLYPRVRLLAAKEKFAACLLRSTKLSACIIRPNGFFADLEEIYHMAAKGKVFQFGDGTTKMNPIDGEDLAKFCLTHINSKQRECDIGGPEVLSINQLSKLAFQAQNKPPSIVSIPDVFRRTLIWIFTKMPEKWVGPPEFFLTMLGCDAIAPVYGEKRIASHFGKCQQQNDVESQ